MESSPLAVGSWSWHAPYYQGAWSLLDMSAAAAGLGIAWIECNDFMLPVPQLSRLRRPLLRLLPGAPPELWRYDPGNLSRLAATAENAGVRVLAWTVNSDFTVPAARWPAQQLYLRLGVAAARRLDARLLRVNLGGRANEPEEVDGRVAGRLARFVRASQRWYPGLHVTVENHWGLSADLDRHLLLLARAGNLLAPADRGRFGACFDPDNMPRGDQRRRWWKGLARLANHYHFKTIAFDSLGSDVGLPHAFLLSLLREEGYAGAFTIEFQGDGDPAEGVRRSRELFERLVRAPAA